MRTIPDKKIVKLIQDYLAVHNSSRFEDVREHVDLWVGSNIGDQRFYNIVTRFFTVINNKIDGEPYYRRGIVSLSSLTVSCLRYGGRYSLKYCEDECKECIPITTEEHVTVNYDDKNKMIYKFNKKNYLFKY